MAAEMAVACRQGRCPPVEHYLADHAELWASPDAILRLLETEIGLRRELGQELALAEFKGRFPQWQTEVQALLERPRPPAEPSSLRFPVVGETVGDLRLMAELGRGAQGRVFLALQPELADRPVVLKMTPSAGLEHLALARLQHTHVVPLYWVQDFPAQNLRALAMPYLGGATLKQILKELADRPWSERTGQDLVGALDRLQSAGPLALPGKGAARQFLARASTVQALCWIGACLAEALHYAHERGLVHLDVKPSNVLLSADAQPMLLDFHLAREPLQPHAPAPAWFGGTPDYMSPEQRQAMMAVRSRQPIPVRVDGRSDLYSLGALLYEALGGPEPSQAPRPRLERCNPQVSIGLADIVHKCLAIDPTGRYPSAGALAAELRRHLADLPLRGVANRSLVERWRKWRRRRPHALAITGLLLLVLATALVLGMVAWNQVSQGREEAEAALVEGQNRLHDRDYAGAERLFGRGLDLARTTPGADDLTEALARALRTARQAEAAQQLHLVAEQVRLLYDVQALAPHRRRGLAKRCRRVWRTRGLIMERFKAQDSPPLQKEIQADLLDLAVSYADLHPRLAEGQGRSAAHREALAILAEAKALFGPSTALYREQQTHAQALGMRELARSASRLAGQHSPRTAWEHYALGRFYLRAGDLAPAAEEFKAALDQQPQCFWPHFYYGVCCHRLGRHRDALVAFHVCVALAPHTAECFHNRALAHVALGQADEALQDYDRALELKPDLADAALNRGILHYRQQHFAEAEADLRRALDSGADPAPVYFNLAVVHLAQKKQAAALDDVRQALRHRPDYREARVLRDRLLGR